MKSILSYVFLVTILVTLHPVNADPVRVYECIVNGEHVFSDHVCGEGAVQRDVKVESRMDAVTIHDHTKVNSSKPRRSMQDRDSRQQRCMKLRKQLDVINNKLRAGFNAKQDERLHDQLRKLDAQYFSLRCSGVAAGT